MTILRPIPMPHVYVVTGGPKHVKIGMSTDVQRRLAEIQTGCPYRVDLLRSWPTRDARKIEARAHTLLGKYRAAGEWFGLPAPVAVQAVAALVDGAPIASIVFCANCAHHKPMQSHPVHATIFRCTKCGKRDRVHVIDF